MKNLKYTTIKDRTQYDDYCNILEELVFRKSDDPNVQDEIDLLTLLIETWDAEHTSMSDTQK